MRKNKNTDYSKKLMSMQNHYKYNFANISPNKIECFVDNSDNRLTGQVLKESEETFRQLFEHMTNAFSLHEVIIDETGEPIDFKYLMVNNAFEKTMHRTTDQVIGKSIYEVAPDANITMIKLFC
jgi:PAS domain-containing protein